MIEYQWVKGAGPGFEGALAVRRMVFVEEQGFSVESEPDGHDTESLHIIACAEGHPVATARLFWEAPGVARIGRVAVLPEWRGCGLGLALMEELAGRAKADGAAAVVLDAQADKATFYERAGYVRTGKTSVDEGCPHVEMEKVL